MKKEQNKSTGKFIENTPDARSKADETFKELSGIPSISETPKLEIIEQCRCGEFKPACPTHGDNYATSETMERAREWWNKLTEPEYYELEQLHGGWGDETDEDILRLYNGVHLSETQPKTSEGMGDSCGCKGEHDCNFDCLNRNWTEDFSHENGNYQNKCSRCELYFIGHKRRTVCKLCATQTKGNEVETLVINEDRDDYLDAIIEAREPTAQTKEPESESKIFTKKGGEWDFINDEIINRLDGVFIDCPECESIIHSDEQYQCGTCNGGARINVLTWIREIAQPFQSQLQKCKEEKDEAIRLVQKMHDKSLYQQHKQDFRTGLLPYELFDEVQDLLTKHK